jgi:5-methylcytosine-specific restriction endonuclease McrA
MKVKCLNCDKEFEKSNTEVKRIPNHYCSKSCSASMNNKKYPKRTKTKKCKRCDALILSNRTYCDKHKNQIIDYTLSECIYDKHHKSSAFALVRSRARSLAKSLGWNSCCKCGYDKHVEIAHIKPISEFPDDTKLSIINNPNNLMPLCPNCHWEFDHQ